MPPTMIRRIVLYTLPDMTQRPAIVVAERWSDEHEQMVLDLEVFGYAHNSLDRMPIGVRFEAEGGPSPGTWSY